MNYFEERPLEKFAHSRYPKKGVCKNTVFANGWHRVGMIPVESLIDGGLAGDRCKAICLECGKEFHNDRCFIPINQPNK